MWRRYGCAVVGTVFLMTASAESTSVRQRSVLVDLLVWGTHVGIDLSAYPLDVRRRIEAVIARSKAYQSNRPRPSRPSELSMVYEAWVGYERRLVAMARTRTPLAEDLASAYVTELAPCYEWEGYSDCPAREASFAGTYRSANPDSPFSDFLALLEAHRWLCAAEGYDYEKNPTGAATARARYRAALLVTSGSPDRLVQIGAAELKARGSCFPKSGD